MPCLKLGWPYLYTAYCQVHLPSWASKIALLTLVPHISHTFQGIFRKSPMWHHLCIQSPLCAHFLATIPSVCALCPARPGLSYTRSACIPYKFFTILCNCIVCKSLLQLFFGAAAVWHCFPQQQLQQAQQCCNSTRHAHRPPSTLPCCCNSGNSWTATRRTNELECPFICVQCLLCHFLRSQS